MYDFAPTRADEVQPGDLYGDGQTLVLATTVCNGRTITGAPTVSHIEIWVTGRDEPLDFPADAKLLICTAAARRASREAWQKKLDDACRPWWMKKLDAICGVK